MMLVYNNNNNGWTDGCSISSRGSMFQVRYLKCSMYLTDVGWMDGWMLGVFVFRNVRSMFNLRCVQYVRGVLYDRGRTMRFHQV